MIEITSKYPGRLVALTLGGYNLTISDELNPSGAPGYTILRAPWSIACYRESETSRYVYDAGWITTTPSGVLPRENDCVHYNVEGRLTRDVPIPDVRFQKNSDYTYSVTVNGTQKSSRNLCDGLYAGEPKNFGYSYYSASSYSYFYNRVKEAWGFSAEYDEEHQAVIIRWEEYIRKEPKERYTRPPYTPDDFPVEVERRGKCECHLDTTYYRHPVWETWRTFNDEEFLRDPSTVRFYYQLDQGGSFVHYLHWASDQEFAYGDLTADAAESVRLLNINALQYGREALEMGSFARSLVSNMSELVGFKSIGTALKAGSSLYLASHYGLKLTMRDTQEIADAIDSWQTEYRYQTIGASHRVSLDYPGRDDCTITCDMRLTGLVDYFSLEQTDYLNSLKWGARALYELDLAPTLSNLWDAVPFSFMADWFAPIGQSFEKLELTNYIRTFQVKKMFYSRKYSWSYREDFVTDSGVHYYGPLTFKYYERDCENKCILPPMRVSNPKGLSGHWLEATAILIQSGL